jgi:transcriptional regulator with XRE-family HTH domain
MYGEDRSQTEGVRVTTRRRTDLVAARKAAGFTQEGLAEALYVDRTTVIRWEAGAHAPLPHLWPKLASLLGVTGNQLQGFLTGEYSAAADSTSPESSGQSVAWDDMKRRTLLKWSLMAGTSATLGAGAGSAVGMTDVTRLQRAAARLYGLDQRHGGDSLWQSALAQAHDGMQLLEHATYGDTVGRHLLRATGQLLVCAGGTALDAGQHEVARSCLADALAMSRQADDAETEVDALALLARQSNALARPREAVRYARGAEDAAGGHGAAPWLAAVPQLRLAVGSSLTGDARQADRAIGSARRILDRCPDATGEKYSYLTPFEVEGVEGACAIHLGHPRRGERLLEQTIAGYVEHCARNLALYRVRLARARLEAGAIDGAVEAAHAALDDLSGEVASWLVGHELAAVARQLAACPTAPGVDRFTARYREVRA